MPCRRRERAHSPPQFRTRTSIHACLAESFHHNRWPRSELAITGNRITAFALVRSYPMRYQITSMDPETEEFLRADLERRKQEALGCQKVSAVVILIPILALTILFLIAVYLR